ncbi:1833_t:CDS:2 [Acaulospora colombiana]|uniref:1833_t:CDS:1 n=1 Tax=Acaulospora colombiana TaxID=27376 RepID=A0ACA9LKS0_9GLOM|nr:1833_t:CDS:2 [Acaulospora colombiana]
MTHNSQFSMAKCHTSIVCNFWSKIDKFWVIMLAKYILVLTCQKAVAVSGRINDEPWNIPKWLASSLRCEHISIKTSGGIINFISVFDVGGGGDGEDREYMLEDLEYVEGDSEHAVEDLEYTVEDLEYAMVEGESKSWSTCNT